MSFVERMKSEENVVLFVEGLPRNCSTAEAGNRKNGVEVEWTSSSVPVEQLDAALRRDRNLTLRFGERLLADSELAPRRLEQQRGYLP
jgi:hypothetical protein